MLKSAGATVSKLIEIITHKPKFISQITRALLTTYVQKVELVYLSSTKYQMLPSIARRRLRWEITEASTR